MQGADMVHTARMYDEILRSYAGIIRIRFLGMISASVTRGTPAKLCLVTAKVDKFLIIPIPDR